MNPLFDEKIVKHLRGLADGSITPKEGWYGMCAELDDLVAYTPEQLIPYFKSWEHFSGDTVYPVSDPENNGSPRQQYDDPSDIWQGRYGELRRDLCAHVADEIEKQLRWIRNRP